MNRKQKIVLAAGATLVLLMLIFPPFHVQFRGTTFNMGYAFVLDPPEHGYITASVNVGMLAVQWLAVLLITALAFFMLKSSRRTHTEAPHPPGAADIPATQGHEVLNRRGPPALRRQHHPWRRFFARMVDISTVGLLLFLQLAFFTAALVPAMARDFRRTLENPLVAGFLLYLAWVPAEAAFLSLAGTTPAKWLFRIRVVHPDGTLLSYREALKRSFLVWVQGLGLGIPIVTAFTQLFAYCRLARTGTTLWDTSIRAVVLHQRWSAARTFVCVAAVFAVLVLLSILNR